MKVGVLAATFLESRYPFCIIICKIEHVNRKQTGSWEGSGDFTREASEVAETV